MTCNVTTTHKFHPPSYHPRFDSTEKPKSSDWLPPLHRRSNSIEFYVSNRSSVNFDKKRWINGECLTNSVRVCILHRCTVMRNTINRLSERGKALTAPPTKNPIRATNRAGSARISSRPQWYERKSNRCYI